MNHADGAFAHTPSFAPKPQDLEDEGGYLPTWWLRRFLTHGCEHLDGMLGFEILDQVVGTPLRFDAWLLILVDGHHEPT
jgi:hypothetical protein